MKKILIASAILFAGATSAFAGALDAHLVQPSTSAGVVSANQAVEVGARFGDASPSAIGGSIDFTATASIGDGATNQAIDLGSRLGDGSPR